MATERNLPIKCFQKRQKDESGTKGAGGGSIPKWINKDNVSGKSIYSTQVKLTEGRNELDFNFNVPTGVLFFSIKSENVNYGTSKIFFK